MSSGRKRVLLAVHGALCFALLAPSMAPAATVHVTNGDPIVWGRRMLGATPSSNITLTKQMGGTQAYTTTVSNNGITAPGGSISGGSGATGTMPVTLVNNANGSGTTGAKTFTVDVEPLTPGQDGRVDVSVTVLSQRSVTNSSPVNFGNLLRGAQVSAPVTLGTSGDDNNRTRVNVGLTVGADANGISVSSGTGGLFNSATSTGTRTLSGTFSNYGTISGSRGLSVTTAEAAGVGDTVSYAPVAISYNAVVGNATADRSNSPTAFGPALAASVGLGQSYVNLDSRVFTSTGSGGGPILNSVATILDGTNSSGLDVGVSMEWRARTQSETSFDEGGAPTYPPLWLSGSLTSDVVRLSGMVNNTSLDPKLTDLYVLQMTYDESLLHAPEVLLAANGLLHLVSLDLSLPGARWTNAVLGNIGGPTTLGSPVLSSYASYKAGTIGSHGAKTAGTFQLGDWGVDTTNNVVWGVLNYNGTFASVPEPSSYALAGCGLLALAFIAARKRRLLAAARRA